MQRWTSLTSYSEVKLEANTHNTVCLLAVVNMMEGPRLTDLMAYKPVHHN